MNREEKKCLRIKRLIENLTEIDNIGKKTRKRQYADLRKAYCKLCKEYTKASHDEIGGVLRKGYDHATVTHSIAKFNELKKQNQFDYIDVYLDVKKILSRVDEGYKKIDESIKKSKSENDNVFYIHALTEIIEKNYSLLLKLDYDMRKLKESINERTAN